MQIHHKAKMQREEIIQAGRVSTTNVVAHLILLSQKVAAAGGFALIVSAHRPPTDVSLTLSEIARA